MIDMSRFEAMLPRAVAEGEHIHIVGCGGIGSYTALTLVKMGFTQFTLQDDDIVEEANVATQAFTDLDVGLKKVVALAGLMKKVNPDVKVAELTTRFEENNTIFGQTVVAALDNIGGRIHVWDSALNNNIFLYVDPRMGAESFEMFAIPYPYQMLPLARWFDKWIRDPLPYSEEPCGAKAIAYTGGMAGAMVASAIRTAVSEAGETWPGAWVSGDMGVFTFKQKSLEFLKEV